MDVCSMSMCDSFIVSGMQLDVHLQKFVNDHPSRNASVADLPAEVQDLRGGF
jgi:hypothetical protein